MKFGICNEIFQDWKIEDTFAYAAKAGYDLVEIAPFTIANSVTDISPARRVELRDAAARAGIGISGLHWVLAKTEGLHINSPDAAVRKRTADYLTAIVDCCADLGGTRVILGSPKQRNIPEGIEYVKAYAWAIDTLREPVLRAGERGVVICIEPLAPSETDFLNTAEQARRFAASYSNPGMSVILDVKAMSSEGKPIPEIIRESAGKFAYFHANDTNLKGPGFGDVDYRPIAAALREVGYDGTVSVEVFDFTEGPEVIATKSIEYLREVFRAG